MSGQILPVLSVGSHGVRTTLASHSMTSMCFFFFPPFLPLLYVLSHCHAGRPIHDSLSVSWLREGGCQDFTVHGPIHLSLDALKSTCALSRETPLKHNAPPSLLDGGDGVLGLIVRIHLSPNTAGRIDTKELDFGFI